MIDKHKIMCYNKQKGRFNMHWKVSWKELGDAEVEVEGIDRWEAVVKAAGILGLDKVFPMQFLFNQARVRKPGTSEKIGRRKDEVGEEGKKAREERLREIKERYGKELKGLIGGDCGICGKTSVLVDYHWKEKEELRSERICQDCSNLLSGPRVLEIFVDSPPFEVQKIYVVSLREVTQALISGGLGVEEGFIKFLKRKGRESGVDIDPWLRKASKVRRTKTKDLSEGG